MKNLFLLCFFIFSYAQLTLGQQDTYYRIKADFTVKEIHTDGTNSITMGQVYYDKSKKKIVYNVLFPEKEVWLFQDSLMYIIKNDVIEKKPLVPGYINFSVFNLALNNSLKDYGLKNNMIFELKDVVKDEDMVISFWKPRNEFARLLGDVKVSVKNNRLFGVLIYDKDQRLIGKQVFLEYIKIGALEFPADIISYTYHENGGENKQLTTYKNIKVNNWDEDLFYNYAIPVH